MLMRQSVPDFAPSVDRFCDFVRERVQSMSAGNMTAFCRALGFNDHGLKGWLNKGERPSFPQFMHLCYGVNVMPTDVFAKLSLPAKGNEFRSLPSKFKERKVCPRPSPQRRKEWEVSLNAKLISQESQAVNMIAADLGVNASCLRYWFPDLCTLLSERHKVAAKTRAEVHHAQQSRRVEEVVRLIHVDGRYPSRRQVGNMLRNEGMSLVEPYLLRAYKKAIGDL